MAKLRSHTMEDSSPETSYTNIVLIQSHHCQVVWWQATSKMIEPLHFSCLLPQIKKKKLACKCTNVVPTTFPANFLMPVGQNFRKPNPFGTNFLSPPKSRWMKREATGRCNWILTAGPVQLLVLTSPWSSSTRQPNPNLHFLPSSCIRR